MAHNMQSTRGRASTTPRSMALNIQVQGAAALSSTRTSTAMVPASSGGTMASYVAAAEENKSIMELTRRLSQSEAKIQVMSAEKHTLERRLQQQQRMVQPMGHNAAYDMLLSAYNKREEELRVATHVNVELDKNVQELVKLVEEMQSESTTKLLQLSEKEEKSSLQVVKIAKLEEENKHHEEEIKQKDGVIKYLKKEKEEIDDKRKKAERTVKKLQDEIDSYQKLVEASKCLAHEHMNVLTDNEKTIIVLEGRNNLLFKKNEQLNEKIKEDAYTIESKDVLLNMQRQQMDEQLNMIQMYEKKFLAKDMDVPKLIARVDEGERVWSKIEEREKKFADRECIVGVLREQNEGLQADKERLEKEVVELNACFKAYNHQIRESGDKMSMTWVLSQLRDSIQLKEKIIELEEINCNGGYTVKAAEAEADFKKKQKDMELEMGKLTETLEMLKSQVNNEADIEVPILIGKLEEALLVYGYEGKDEEEQLDDIVSQILSATSSDMLTLNTNESYVHEEWVKSPCVTARDFKGLMSPQHYEQLRDAEKEFDFGITDGLCACGPQQDADYVEDRDDIFMDASKADDIDDEDISVRTEPADREEQDKIESDEDEGALLAKKEEVKQENDHHLEKVLKIATETETDSEDWRTWVRDMPVSPCSCATAE